MVEVRLIGDALVVRMKQQRLDAHVAVNFRNVIKGYVESGHKKIVLDLSQVDFIDSSGLGALVAAHKVAKGKAAFALCGLQQTTASMLRLTRMDKVFVIHEEANAATKAMTA